MKFTRKQKEQDFLNKNRNIFKSKEISKDYFCKECNKSYKGQELWLRESYGSIGSRYYVALDYICPQKHEIKSVKSEEFNNTVVDHLFSLLIIIVIVIITMLLFKFCPSDLPPIKYK